MTAEMELVNSVLGRARREGQHMGDWRMDSITWSWPTHWRADSITLARRQRHMARRLRGQHRSRGQPYIGEARAVHTDDGRRTLDCVSCVVAWAEVPRRSGEVSVESGGHVSETIPAQNSGMQLVVLSSGSRRATGFTASSHAPLGRVLGRCQTTVEIAPHVVESGST